MISEEERNAKTIFENLYPERDFKSTQLIPRDIEQLEGQASITEADVISVENGTIRGCEVKAGTSSIEKGFDQLNTLYEEAESQGFDVDYRLLVFDKDVLRLKNAYRELQPVFEKGNLMDDFDMTRINTFLYGDVVKDFDFRPEKELVHRDRIPRHDFEFLEKNGYVNQVDEDSYVPTEEAVRLAETAQNLAYFGTRIEHIHHPDELICEKPYQSI